MRMWIDTSACATDETFHIVTTSDEGSDVRHSDGSPCDEVEFQITEDDDDDN